MKHKVSSSNFLSDYSRLGGYEIFNLICDGIQDKSRGYRFINKYKIYDL